MLRRAFIAVCVLVLGGTAAAQQLSDTEQRIAAAVRQRSAAALDLLERSVRINSGTLNTEGVREVGALYRAELDAMGFATRWAQMPATMPKTNALTCL